MKVLLVNPPRFNGIPVIREDRCENADRNCVQPPTSYVYIASILKNEGHQVRLIDCNAYDIEYLKLTYLLLRSKIKEDFDYLVFRSTPATFFSDCKTAELVKNIYPKIKTVMLNWNLSAFSLKALELAPSVDFYVHSYSYEKIIPRLVNGEDPDDIDGVTYHEDDLIIRNEFDRKEKIGDIPKPLWNLLPDHSVFYTRVKSFSPWAVVRGSKGCGMGCSFCVDYNIPFDPRTPGKVVDEVEDLVSNHKIKYLSFFDNTFTLNRCWALDIIHEIINREIKVKWFINTRVNSLDEELLKEMKTAGLDGISLGVESGSDSVLQRMNKKTTVKKSLETVKLIKKHGIKVYLSLMMGYLDETEEEMKETYNFILKSKPNGFQLNITAPFPGTPLYDECLEKNLITDGLSWDELSCVPTSLSGNLAISKLSNEKLNHLRRKFYWKLYFHPAFLGANVWWVISHPSDLRHALRYFASNLERLLHKVTFSH